jgi:hypothetical protein
MRCSSTRGAHLQEVLIYKRCSSTRGAHLHSKFKTLATRGVHLHSKFKTLFYWILYMSWGRNARRDKNKKLFYHTYWLGYMFFKVYITCLLFNDLREVLTTDYPTIDSESEQLFIVSLYLYWSWRYNYQEWQWWYPINLNPATLLCLSQART